MSMKLSYFSLAGKAEATRLMLNIGEIAHEDERFGFQDWRGGGIKAVSVVSREADDPRGIAGPRRRKSFNPPAPRRTEAYSHSHTPISVVRPPHSPTQYVHVAV